MLRCLDISMSTLSATAHRHWFYVFDMDNEDVYYQNALDYLGAPMPSLDECHEFCLQTPPLNKINEANTSFAWHAIYNNGFLQYDSVFTKMIQVIDELNNKLRDRINAPRRRRDNSGKQGGTILQLD